MLEHTVKRVAEVSPALAWAQEMILRGLEAGEVVLVLRRPLRSLDQNKKLWVLLNDVAAQVEWHGNYLTREEWKTLFTAAFEGQTAIEGIHGGLVYVDSRTSRMDREKFSELIEFIYSEGSELGVKWSEDADLLYGKIILRGG